MSVRGALRTVGSSALGLLVVVLATVIAASVLAPPPDAAVTRLALPIRVEQPRPALPSHGAAAAATGDERPLTAGSGTALPLVAVAKLVTVLTVLEARPLADGRSGPTIPVTADDVAYHRSEMALSQRTQPMLLGDTWTESDAVAATVVASSNDTAVMLASWAFGSQDGYLAAARSWLQRHGLRSVRVLDATGLADGDVGSAADVARIGALAAADPALSALADRGSFQTVHDLAVTDDIALEDSGRVTMLSRSYSDAGGVCAVALWHGTLNGVRRTVAVALLGEPDWTTLASDLRSFAASAGRLRGTVLPARTPVLRLSTAWGRTADAVTAEATTAFALRAGSVTSTVTPPITSGATAGTRSGVVTLTAPSGRAVVPLTLTTTLTGPDLLWRVTHPAQLVPRFVAAVRSVERDSVDRR